MEQHRDYEITVNRIANLFANTVFLNREGDEYESIVASQAQKDPGRQG